MGHHLLEGVSGDRLASLALLPGEHNARLPGPSEALDRFGDELPTSALGVDGNLYLVRQLTCLGRRVAVMLPPVLIHLGDLLTMWISRLDFADLRDWILAPQCQQWVTHPGSPCLEAA